MIHAGADAAGWSFYGLADLPADRRTRMADLLDDLLRRGARWLARSPGCALLLPDAALPPTLSTSEVGCARTKRGRHVEDGIAID
jgi:hypothetical protein